MCDRRVGTWCTSQVQTAYRELFLNKEDVLEHQLGELEQLEKPRVESKSLSFNVTECNVAASLNEEVKERRMERSEKERHTHARTHTHQNGDKHGIRRYKPEITDACVCVCVCVCVERGRNEEHRNSRGAGQVKE
jgi:hypothetical protein